MKERVLLKLRVCLGWLEILDKERVSTADCEQDVLDDRVWLWQRLSLSDRVPLADRVLVLAGHGNGSLLGDTGAEDLLQRLEPSGGTDVSLSVCADLLLFFDLTVLAPPSPDFTLELVCEESPFSTGPTAPAVLATGRLRSLSVSLSLAAESGISSASG